MDGSPLAGRRLLLHAEQGLGDAIQFVRYAPLIRGGTVIVECHPPLARLLASVGGVDRVIARGDPLPPFDVECPLMSLPLLFGTTASTVPGRRAVPAGGRPGRCSLARTVGGRTEPGRLQPGRDGVAYRRPRLRRWRDPRPPRRPGLGRRRRPCQGPARSIAVEAFAPLAAVPGVRLFSLQVGRPAPDWTADWTADLRDVADAAALVSQLDVVVTIDTMLAHLAGSLGRPTWVLLPFAPDWRWLLGRDDSPWYPSAQLFRQDAPGDWTGAIGRVAAALAAVARGAESSRR